MDNGVDIIVVSDGGHPEVVVEVNVSSQLDDATARIREYMRGVGASIGLVVGRERMRLLRDTYRARDSIEIVGDFPTSGAGLLVSQDPFEFEESVQTWLESLAHDQEAVAEPLRSVLRRYVVPFVEAGSVRAARPRVRRIAS